MEQWKPVPEFGVTPANISAITLRKTWSHIA